MNRFALTEKCISIRSISLLQLTQQLYKLECELVEQLNEIFVTGEECVCRDWHGCIMAQSIVGLENVQPYKFSECSKNDYIDLLRASHGGCMMNKPNEVSYIRDFFFYIKCRTEKALHLQLVAYFQFQMLFKKTTIFSERILFYFNKTFIK